MWSPIRSYPSSPLTMVIATPLFAAASRTPISGLSPGAPRAASTSAKSAHFPVSRLPVSLAIPKARAPYRVASFRPISPSRPYRLTAKSVSSKRFMLGLLQRPSVPIPTRIPRPSISGSGETPHPRYSFDRGHRVAATPVRARILISSSETPEARCAAIVPGPSSSTLSAYRTGETPTPPHPTGSPKTRSRPPVPLRTNSYSSGLSERCVASRSPLSLAFRAASLLDSGSTVYGACTLVSTLTLRGRPSRKESAVLSIEFTASSGESNINGKNSAKTIPAIPDPASWGKHSPYGEESHRKVVPASRASRAELRGAWRPARSPSARSFLLPARPPCEIRGERGCSPRRGLSCAGGSSGPPRWGSHALSPVTNPRQQCVPRAPGGRRP